MNLSLLRTIALSALIACTLGFSHNAKATMNCLERPEEGDVSNIKLHTIIKLSIALNENVDGPITSLLRSHREGVSSDLGFKRTPGITEIMFCNKWQYEDGDIKNTKVVRELILRRMGMDPNI